MTTIFLIIIWIILCLALWIFTIYLTVTDKAKNESNPKWESKIKSFFYWLAVILSLIIGILIKS